MAKAKSEKTERQAKIDAIRSQQKNDEKRRGLMIIGVCVAVALLIVGAAAYQPIKNWWDLREFRGLDLAEIGVPASECGEVDTKPATGDSDHQNGVQLTYEDSPPAFGPHWSEEGAPAPFERKFYTQADRPELEALVHNLEHGYTILWYDETIAEDDSAVTEIRGLASKFADSDNFRSKFIAAPWTSEDGDAFPDDQHVAFSHWSVGGDNDAQDDDSEGVWQYCPATSGEALETFMLDYPYLDSPEPEIP